MDYYDAGDSLVFVLPLHSFIFSFSFYSSILYDHLLRRAALSELLHSLSDELMTLHRSAAEQTILLWAACQSGHGPMHR